MKKEMALAKGASNTDYYDRTFVIIGHPLTGEIVAMAGLKTTKEGLLDITNEVISSSYTVGSIVKGASISVGYKEGIIKKGKKIKDACIKVYGVPKKCSWSSLGMIDEISALAYSSNYYQFYIASKLANPQYKWNSKLNVTSDNFKKYRDVFASYGLGVKTGIDLPNEKTGIIGKKESDDLYLNLAIGQYDTYTPIEVFQYINTLANNGVRIKPTLMSKIMNKNRVIVNRKTEVLNESILTSADITSVQKGFEAVMKYGTGKNYNATSVLAAGKTGTSETFIDSNNDGVVDTPTTTSSFISYAPIDTKEYSIVIISPNIAKRKENGKTYKYALNLKLNRKIMELLFENA
jgi:cell division protein FtsI/penicillin-binding protein 2